MLDSLAYLLSRHRATEKAAAAAARVFMTPPQNRTVMVGQPFCLAISAQPTHFATSGTLAPSTPGQYSAGASGHSGHTKRQPEERDRSMDKKVNTLSVGVLRIIVCPCVSIPAKG